MLDPRIYRAGLVVAALGLIVLAFSLANQPAGSRSTLAPGAFDGQSAYTSMQALYAKYPSRPPGSSADDRLGHCGGGDARVLAVRILGHARAVHRPHRQRHAATDRRGRDPTGHRAGLDRDHRGAGWRGLARCGRVVEHRGAAGARVRPVRRDAAANGRARVGFRQRGQRRRAAPRLDSARPARRGRRARRPGGGRPPPADRDPVVRYEQAGVAGAGQHRGAGAGQPARRSRRLRPGRSPNSRTWRSRSRSPVRGRSPARGSRRWRCRCQASAAPRPRRRSTPRRCSRRPVGRCWRRSRRWTRRPPSRRHRRSCCSTARSCRVGRSRCSC